MNFFFMILSLLFSAAKKRTAHFNPNTKDETHITIQKQKGDKKVCGYALHIHTPPMLLLQKNYA